MTQWQTLRDRYRRLRHFARALWRALPDPLVLDAALIAVLSVESDLRHRAVVKRESSGNIAFCPRCGQLPSRDYRHEQVLEQVLASVPAGTRLSEIHFAIELAHRSIAP